MIPLSSRLQQLEEMGTPIRVGVVGAGEYSSGLVRQLHLMKGLRPAVIADLDVFRGVSLYKSLGWDESQISVGETEKALNESIDRERPVVASDAVLLAQSHVDVLVDATGSAEAGAQVAYAAIEAGKHIVTVNVESAVVVGAILSRLASRAGVIYTLADGDQPSLGAGLCEWCQTLGLEVVAAGKGTSLYAGGRIPDPLPDDAPQARHALIAHYDGTKTQIEMAAIANVVGLTVDTPGMHGPRLALREVADAFSLVAEGGLLQTRGVVEYVNCLGDDEMSNICPELAGGVFAVVTCEDREQIGRIIDKHVIGSRDRQYALFHRPYHLIGVETPYSVVRAVLSNEATAASAPVPTVDVVAVAKRALRAGEVLDGIGSDMVKGVAYSASAARQSNYLPLGLADGVTINQDVPQGAPLSRGMLKEGKTTLLWHLRGLQDRVCYT